MFLWPIIEWGLIVVVGTFVLTQMIIPVLQGKPTFPLFKKSTRNLEKAVGRLQEEKINRETKNVKLELAKMKREQRKLKKIA